MTQPFYGPDTFGPQQIPLAPLPAEMSGDPALYYILSFLQAFLCTDQNAVAQWSISGVAPGKQPVAKTVIGRPDSPSYQFNVSYLPILFAYRDGSTIDYWGDDWGVKKTTVRLVWALPLGQPNAMGSRMPYYDAFGSCVYAGIERGRTPSWVQPGDADPLAAVQGSLFYTFAGFVHFNVESWKPAELSVRQGNGPPQKYPGLFITCELVERYAPGITNRDPNTAGAQIDIQAVTGSTVIDQFVVGRTQAPPTITSLSPATGTVAGGTSVTLIGTGLRAGVSVQVGGSFSPSVTVNSSTSITFTTPASGTTYPQSADVVVTNNDGQSATLAGGFAFTLP